MGKVSREWGQEKLVFRILAAPPFPRVCNALTECGGLPHAFISARNFVHTVVFPLCRQSCTPGRARMQYVSRTPRAMGVRKSTAARASATTKRGTMQQIVVRTCAMSAIAAPFRRLRARALRAMILPVYAPTMRALSSVPRSKGMRQHSWRPRSLPQHQSQAPLPIAVDHSRRPRRSIC